MSVRRFYWVVFVGVPFGCVALAGVIAGLIPHCRIDEGAGASAGCGPLGPVLAFMMFGGFIGGMAGLLAALPLALLMKLFGADIGPPQRDQPPTEPQTIIDGSTLEAFRKTFGEMQASLTDDQRSLLRDKLKTLHASRVAEGVADQSGVTGYSAEALRDLLHGRRLELTRFRGRVVC